MLTSAIQLLLSIRARFSFRNELSRWPGRASLRRATRYAQLSRTHTSQQPRDCRDQRVLDQLFWGGAAVYRFGSRVDDGKCGGDIDLYIETDEADVRVLDAKYDFLARLKQRIGDQRIDVLVSFPSRKHKAIIEIAKALSALGVGSAPSRGPRDLSPPW